MIRRCRNCDCRLGANLSAYCRLCAWVVNTPTEARPATPKTVPLATVAVDPHAPLAGSRLIPFPSVRLAHRSREPRMGRHRRARRRRRHQAVDRAGLREAHTGAFKP